MEQPTMHQDSPAWLFFVHAAFVLSLALTSVGIYHLPVSLWVKGYFAMGHFFTVGSTVTLCKTLRDQHEARKLVNRINEVKTERLLNDYTMARE